MKTNKEKEILKILKKLEPTLFNGHTEFKNLTNEQKIIWIMQISLFIFETYSSLIREPKM